MHTCASFLSAASLAAFVCLQDPQEPSAPQESEPAPGGLQRVAPLGSDDTAQQPPAGISADALGPFDEQGWRQRLRDPDHARREVAFDRIVQLALGDAGVRAWIGSLAAAPEQGDLAWTARLALRELDLLKELAAAAVGASLDPTWAPQALGHDQDALRTWLDAWSRSLEPQLLDPEAGDQLPPHGIQVEHDGLGCRVRVVEVVDGEELVREYRGASLQDILLTHPELEQRYGLNTLGRGMPLDRVEGESASFDPSVFGVYISQLDEPTRERLELPAEEGGLLVLGTASGTYAQALGITVGDVLLEVNGNLLRGLEDISLIMSQRAPLDPIEVLYVDNWGRHTERSWVTSSAPASPAPARGDDE